LSNVYTRATVIFAIKYSITDHPHPIDALLVPIMPAVLARLAQEDLKEGLIVRYECLLTLNYAAHNKPALVRELLDGCLKNIYDECKCHQELTRTVIIGPFKHKVDDGLETRKAAFECLYTLLETCQDCLDISDLINLALKEGLNDEHDIKLLAHMILSRLAHCAPQMLINSLGTLLPVLKGTLEKKMKDNAVKQDKDRNDELIFSALRALVAISRIPGLDSTEFNDFMSTTVVGDVAENYKKVLDAEKGNDELKSQ